MGCVVQGALIISPFVNLASRSTSSFANTPHDFIDLGGGFRAACDYIGITPPPSHRFPAPSLNPKWHLLMPRAHPPVEGEKLHTLHGWAHCEGVELFRSPYVNPVVQRDASWWKEAMPGDGKTVVTWGTLYVTSLTLEAAADARRRRRQGDLRRRRRGILPPPREGQFSRLALLRGSLLWRPYCPFSRGVQNKGATRGLKLNPELTHAGRCRPDQGLQEVWRARLDPARLGAFSALLFPCPESPRRLTRLESPARQSVPTSWRTRATGPESKFTFGLDAIVSLLSRVAAEAAAAPAQAQSHQEEKPKKGKSATEKGGASAIDAGREGLGAAHESYAQVAGHEGKVDAQAPIVAKGEGDVLHGASIEGSGVLVEKPAANGSA